MPEFKDLISKADLDRVIAAIIKGGDMSGEIYRFPGQVSATPPPVKPDRCIECGGKGTIEVFWTYGGNREYAHTKTGHEWEDCRRCGGTGEEPNEPEE